MKIADPIFMMSYVDWPPWYEARTTAEFETTFADLGLKAPIMTLTIWVTKTISNPGRVHPHLLGGLMFWVWPRPVATKTAAFSSPFA